MKQTVLGRTGVSVSRMGLGCGGHSRLGLSFGKSDEEASLVVREALSLGVNFIDTAESYKTERAVGLGIKGVPRESVFISTKAGVDHQDRLSTPEEYRDRVHACLERLDTDYIDLFNLHGVTVDEYDHGIEHIVPVLERLREEGKVRFIGITEQFLTDTNHRMFRKAAAHDVWDVVMIGFSILNPSARQSVLPWTREKRIGTQCMFAVRRALSRPEALRDVMQRLVSSGQVDPGAFNPDDPLDFLSADGIAGSITEAAYRYCLHEPGFDVILSGTSNLEHLKANARSLDGPPLPPEVCARIESIFGRVDSVSGN